MAFFPFSIFSPSGNTTLFLYGKYESPVARGHICAEAMRLCGEYVEQAAFADLESRYLAMGGGEFCVNASRAFGVLLDCYSPLASRVYEINISGLEGPARVEVGGEFPLWRSTARFCCADFHIKEIEADMVQVDLPGISHLLLKSASIPPSKLMPELTARMGEKHKLVSKDAFGIVWWRQNGSLLEIWPYVTVPKSGTAMLENACGSASLCLAIARRAASPVLISQPGGEVLEAAFKNGEAMVGGSVSFIKSGIVHIGS